MAIVRAQIISITPDQTKVVVSPLTGPYKNEAFGFLPARADSMHGQFVDIDIHPSGQCVEWPS